MNKANVKKQKPKVVREEHGFVTLTYGLRLDPKALTDKLIERIENNEVELEELFKLGAESTHFEGTAWRQ